MAERFKPCSIEGCNRNANYTAGGRKGLCGVHYQRQWKHGDPQVKLVAQNECQDWLISHIGHTDDGCLIWPYSRHRNGYGQTSYMGRKSLAHRVMCELVNGPAPSEFHEAAHSCGNGHLGCVHPKHLHWATPKENSEEMVAHGTSSHGERNGNAKLTAPDVRRIRDLCRSRTRTAIAKEYGVSISIISMIANGRRWRNL